MSQQDCYFLNPLQRDGTNQNQRALPALSPDSAKIDDRTLADLLVYLYQYAGLLSFYNDNDMVDGSWQALIANDVTVQAALISVEDFSLLRTQFDDIIQKMENQGYNMTRMSLLYPLFEKILSQLGDWFEQTDESQTIQRILNGVRNLIADTLSYFPPDYDGTNLIKQWRLNNEFEQIGFVFGANYPQIKPQDSASEKAAKFELASLALMRQFNAILEIANYLKTHVHQYIDETLTNYPKHQPQIALILTFLQLFQAAQQQLNSLSQAHLDFYYKEVLKLTPKGHQPDQVHLIFAMAKHLNEYKIDQDTFVKAGKDDLGKPLFYATDEDIVLNKTQIDVEQGLKSFFVARDEKDEVLGFYHAPVASSEDGLNIIENQVWNTFGNEQVPAAKIGFALASSMFLLAEGEREISLRVTAEFEPDELLKLQDEEQKAKLFENIEVSASGAEGWVKLKLQLFSVAYADGQNELDEDEIQLTFKLSLKTTDPAIVAYNAELMGLAMEAQDPVIRFQIKNAQPHPFALLKSLRLKNVVINTKVKGLRNLIVDSNLGLLNPLKPFQPFGAVPKKGNQLFIGSHEAFQKPLKNFDLNIQWSGLPETNFSDHYAAYKQAGSQDQIVVNNCHFKAKMGVLSNGTWLYEYSGTPKLFDSYHIQITEFDDHDNERRVKKERLKEMRVLSFGQDLPRPKSFSSFTQYEYGLHAGFVQLELQQDFLQSMYPKLLADSVTDKIPDVPNPPYVPVINGLSLDYEAEEFIDFEHYSQNSNFSYYHLMPFGFTEFREDQRFLLNPHFISEQQQIMTSGELYIGLQDLAAPQTLSILFQVAESSANPEKQTQVHWSYLTGNRWQDFQSSEILADRTNGLITSGIVQLAIPKQISSDNTLLPAGLFWIKASVANATDAVANIIAIKPHAVLASFRNQDNDLGFLNTALAAETISKLKQRSASIKELNQPYSSFGGKPPEKTDSFYQRVSERLRHKHRAITIFDYERLVLENFPEVYKVKCINHTGLHSEYSPGEVFLVVVPDLRNKNAVDPLRPRLPKSNLVSIQQFLQQYTPDFVSIEVKNPQYEAIQVDVDVVLKAGFEDKGFYEKQLEADIIRFLSPWLYDDAADIAFGGRIHRNWILNYIERLDYVDYITEFSIDHIVDIETQTIKPNVEEAQVTSSKSVLVSHSCHRVSVLDAQSCQPLIKEDSYV